MKPPRPAPITAAGVLLIVVGAEVMLASAGGIVWLATVFKPRKADDLEGDLLCASIVAPIFGAWLLAAGINTLRGAFRSVWWVAGGAGSMGFAVALLLADVVRRGLVDYANGRFDDRWLSVRNAVLFFVAVANATLLLLSGSLLARRIDQYARWRQSRRPRQVGSSQAL